MDDQRSLGKVEVALPAQRFEEFLQLRGMHDGAASPVARSCLSTARAFRRVEELILQLPRRNQPGHVKPSDGAYRTLNEFVDAGLLRPF
ncbi:MAG: hypothetical protein R3B96_05675 [Pirellulaceae bacterium]